MRKSKINVFISSLVIATSIALLFRVFILEDYRILSNSMAPNLLQGDLVFVSKSHYSIRLPFSDYEVVRFRQPSHFETVVLSLPDRPSETFIKRIVAVAGDTVELKEGVLILNGKAASYRNDTDKKYVWEKLGDKEIRIIQPKEQSRANYGPVTIPKDSFFVLGDNREESLDGRLWGPLPYTCVKGRAQIIWLSLDPNGGIRTQRFAQWVS